MVRKLGLIRFPAGHYVYVGRAFGRGGLGARLTHHLNLSVSPHWHIDFLRPHGTISAIWYGLTTPSDEHEWAQAMAQIRGATVPAVGFGSSDCRCASHLIRFVNAPGKATFRRHLRGRAGRAVPVLHCIAIDSSA